MTVAHPTQPDSHGGLLVRPTLSHREAHACHELVRRMYAWRGYLTEPASPHLSHDRLTLAAWRDGELAATLTLSRDSGSNLLAEALYPAEIADLRSKGRAICEYSHLAIDPVTSSTQLMEHFFRTAYDLAKSHFFAKEAIVEINPRHRRFYEREIGFTQLGPLRVCPRVDAPALLLHRDMEQPHKARLRVARGHLQLPDLPVVRHPIMP
ncbi:MAG: hypothetical protein PHV02_06040 [Rhodocyclaceae bacterium]|nr:hypothetical protein [Rhodocyclaceae bacterium]